MTTGQETALPRLSKRMKTVRAKVDRNKAYSIEDALKLVKESAIAKFDESVDIAVNLGIDAKKSDQTVRGSVVLPAGTGKKVRVAVFAQGEKAKEAQAAGADIVGFDDLAAKVKEGFMDFDVVIAYARRDEGRRPARPDTRAAGPDAQSEGRHGHGRRGDGGQELAGRSGAIPHRQGRHRPMHDRARVVHAGRAEDEPGRADRRAEQGASAGTKGIYLKKISVSSTMGAGVKIDSSSLQQQQPAQA